MGGKLFFAAADASSNFELWLYDPATTTLEAALKGLGIEKMTAYDAGAWVRRTVILRKDPEPRP